MTSLIRLSIAILAASALQLHPLDAADLPGPTLRQTNYLALLPVPGRQQQVVLTTRQYSPRYADALQFTLVGRDSSTVAAGEVLPNREFRLSVPAASEGLHVLELESGWNACRIDTGATPSAFVARETVPLQTAGAVRQLFFYVPQGMKQFSVWLVASTPQEGARVRIAGPDGQAVLEEEGDYDAPQRLRVQVPAGTGGKAWSLALLKPSQRALAVDDVRLWLDPSLPPYLATREDWALSFGKRKHP